ncbi:type II restriction endonuclease subunit M [Halorussus sp. MSC15.2]|nr:type II restriction endonuclease subunit M [Halorussus sp. MSC15.2]
MQCIEYFQEQEDSQPWELTDRIKEELETIEGRQGNASLYAKREIILNNLYGVDIDDGAVEICKLRLWLSMVADIEDDPDEVEKLPNIDFNIRQGNSLIGFTEVKEIAREEQGDHSLSNFGAGAGTGVKELYDDVIQAQERHRRSDSSSEAQNARQIAESKIDQHSRKLDEKIVEEFQEAGIEGVDLERVQDYSPFHWVLEFAPVYRDGGFDVIIGNPPWDMLYANRDDFFVRYDEQFQSYSSDRKDVVMEFLLEDDTVKKEWEEYQESIETRADYFTKGNTYNLQSPVVGGRTMPTKNELSALFLERIYKLSNPGVKVSLLLPGTIFGGVMGKDLRSHLLDNADVQSLIGFENKGIFNQIHPQYRFAVLTCEYGGKTKHLRSVFNQRDTGVLYDIEEIATETPRSVLVSYSPEGGIFPNITSQREVDVLKKVVEQPSLGEDIENAWSVDILTKEFVESTDKDRLLTSPDDADYPVYGGKNFHQFEYDNTHTEELDDPKYWSRDLYDPENSAKYRVREKKFNRGNLKRAIYDAFGGEETSKSQVQFVDDLLEDYRGHGLEEQDVLLDCSEYRIGIRDVSRSRDERTIIATVLPKDVVCLHTINTLKPFEINPEESHLSESPLCSPYVRRFTDKELFVATGLLNSIAFDFLMRTKVETHIIKREMLESQLPRLTEGDDWFHYISERAARLNCYGEDFEEMRERLGGIEPATTGQERRELQAEIDAAAFHAYGLDAQEVKFILDDFHRVENPRLMDEDYFDMVFEKYDYLDIEGPME